MVTFNSTTVYMIYMSVYEYISFLSCNNAKIKNNNEKSLSYDLLYY